MKKLEQKPVEMDLFQAEEKRNFGDIYFESGNLPGAEDIYTVAINHDPKNPITYCHRATVRAIQGKSDEAK